MMDAKSDSVKIFDTASITKVSWKDGRRIQYILAIAVFLLGCVLLTFAIGAVIYVDGESPMQLEEQEVTQSSEELEENSSRVGISRSPLEFHVKVPRQHFNQTVMVHQYITIDVGLETEYILFKDPEMFHIQDIIFIDHRNNLQILYGSETAKCLFTTNQMSSLEERLEFLWQNKDMTVAMPKKYTDFTKNLRVASMGYIPVQMTPFCSLENSYWMNMDTNTKTNEYHVCVCSYAFCWCTYCDDPDCWGKCTCCPCNVVRSASLR